jgi:uncharacterized protein involved in propanediol utilization
VQGALRRTDAPGWDEVVVTLPTAIFGCTACFVAAPSAAVTVLPADRAKAARAARLTLDHLGAKDRGGYLTLRNDAPAGCGAGSSTMDVVATIRAVAAALDAALPDETVSRLAVAAEGASDPVMFAPAPARIYAFRRGATVALLPGPLPPLHVLGLSDGGPVDSLALGRRRQFTEPMLDDYQHIFDTLRRGIDQRDPLLVAKAATRSALLNQRVLAKPNLAACLGLVEDGIAAGVAVAHSGNLIGLLFAAAAPDTEARTAEATRRLARSGLELRYRFTVPPVAAAPPPG